MILINSFMFILMATHGVKGDAWSEEVNEDIGNLNSTVANSTVKDDFGENSNTEKNEITTSDILIASNDDIIDPTLNFKEENKDDDIDDTQIETDGEENVSDIGRIKSTANQRTNKEDTSSFIEVEEQSVIKPVIKPAESQLDESSRKSTAQNKTSKATESIIGKGMNGEKIDLSNSTEDSSTNRSVIIEETSETPSTTTDDDIAVISKSDTEDFINIIPNYRRMFSEPGEGKDFKTKNQFMAHVPDTPAIVSSPLVQNLGPQLPINSMDTSTRLTTEARTFEPARLITPYVSLLPPDHLNQPYSYAQPLNKPNLLSYQPNLLFKQQGQFDISANEIPSFRTWNLRSTKPTLAQQIQPYVTAPATIPTPPDQNDIIIKLLLATRALRLSLAKQYMDWYRRNLISFLNNANRPYVSRY